MPKKLNIIHILSRFFYSALTWVKGMCVLPRGMPKRKGKDVLDMTKQCTLSFMVRQEDDEEAAAEPEDEDDEDDGGESEGEDEDE